MKVLIQVVLVLPLFLHCEALSCWQCLDMAGEEGSCADSGEQGKEFSCPSNATGCYINQITSHDVSKTLRDCAYATDPASFKCDVHQASHMMIRMCLCKGDKCNADFDTAAGPALQCYDCNSSTGDKDCTDENTNPPDTYLKNCPFERRQGCSISRSRMGSSADEVTIRECTDQANPEQYACNTYESHGNSLKYCNCHGNKCNQNWDTAAPGSSGVSQLLPSVLLLLPLLRL